MPAANEIKISCDCIRYGDAIIRVANISRMYIVKFFNRDRQKYHDALEKYENDKRIYEIVESNKKASKLRNCIITAILFFLMSVVLFQTVGRTAEQITPIKVIEVLCIVVSAVCILMAILTFRKNVAYGVEPPAEKTFPDRHGLFIELNSGKSVVFTALDEIGRQSLRILRDNINDAALQQSPIIFNMTENHISVENNDGIISTGDEADNIVNKEF